MLIFFQIINYQKYYKIKIYVIGIYIIQLHKTIMSSNQNPNISQNLVSLDQRCQMVTNTEMSNKLHKNLKKTILYLQYGAWNQISQKIVNVKKLPTEELKLNWNRRQHIIKEITLIQFPDLQILDLSHNNISTIQILPRLNIPRIKQIMLKNNNILEINAMKNMFCPFLEWLTLNGNRIRDFQPITKLYAPNLKSLWIDNYSYSRNAKADNNQPQLIGTENLTFLFKMDNAQLQYIKLNLKDRLICPAIDQQFQRRFLRLIH